MKRHLFGAGPLLLAAGACAAPLAAPAFPATSLAPSSPSSANGGALDAGRDYVSVQLASGDALALEALYRHHAQLPYLRIERRGALHVLRAGFWGSAREARAALAGIELEQAVIRIAAYKPQEIVRGNWEGAPLAAAMPSSAFVTASFIAPTGASAGNAITVSAAPTVSAVPSSPLPLAPPEPAPRRSAMAQALVLDRRERESAAPAPGVYVPAVYVPAAAPMALRASGTLANAVTTAVAAAASSAPTFASLATAARDARAEEAEPRLRMSDEPLLLAALTERMPAPVTSVPKAAEPQLLPPPKPAQGASASTSTSTSAPAQAALSDKEELLPFNQDDYLLAFDIFAGAGDLKRAFRVAEKAVASVPDDMEWRLKLARVAEWTQRPGVAWTQREYMFRRGDRSEETLTAILRLTPVATNIDTVIAVWELRADRGRLTVQQWNELQALFETASKPRQGSQYFEAQFRKRGDPALLARAAQLADNAGDEERAYALYVERLNLKPFTVDLALRAVVFLLRKDRNREAYELMRAHQAEVPAEATEFWRVLAQTSWELAELGTAEEAYRKYLASRSANQEATAADWSRLIALVRQRHPGEAAELAMQVYRRYKNLDYLVLALTIRTDASDLSAQARIFAGLSEDERRAAEKDNRFLVLRAQYYQFAGKTELAWADFRAAMAGGRLDTEVTVPALWFLIDSKRMGDLEAMLSNLAPRAREDSAYWLAYAAAYHALDRYREAIFWYRKEIERKPGDSLTLLNYADCLDRYQLTGMADRVRQHVWLQLREQQPQFAQAKPGELQPPFDATPDLLAFVRLALLNQPGDPALAIVRDVSAKLRGLPTLRGDDRETRTLILSWAVATEQFQNARAWMWLRYARSAAARVAASEDFDPRAASAAQAEAAAIVRQGGAVAAQTGGEAMAQAAAQDKADTSATATTAALSRNDPRGTAPLWAQAQTALQLNDTQTMDRLLMRQADGLPIYNRYDTAYALEHWQQALDLAFRGMEKNPGDEDLHDRFRQHAPLHSAYIQGQMTRDAYGDLDSRSQQLEAGWWMFRKLQVKATFTRAQQSSGNEDFGPLVASNDRLMNVSLRYLRVNETSTELDVFRRKEAETLTGLRLTQNLRLSARVAVDATGETRGNATESIPLRIAGYTDNLGMGMTYTISKREYIRVAGRIDRFHTQFGDYLGSAKRVDIDVGYRIRTEYPDWRVRAFLARQVVTRDGSISADHIARLPPSVQGDIAGGNLDALRYFLPDGSTTMGLCFGAGENLAGSNLQEVYTRAWRPFYEACKQHNSINGAGYIGQFGIAGSVIGPDHLSLRFETSRGGSGAGALARTLALRYRYYF